MLEFLVIILAAVAALALIVFASKRTGNLDRKYYSEKWQHIEKNMQVEDVGPRLAVIDADKLLDKAMKQSGIAGENMGDRLRNSQDIFSRYQSVWEAHKLRNRLVHDDVKLRRSEAKAALRTFQKALKDIGAL